MLLVDDMTVQEAQYASEPQPQQQQDPDQVSGRLTTTSFKEEGAGAYHVLCALGM